MTRNFFGTAYSQNGLDLSPRQMLEITENNSEAFKEMRIAKRNNDVAVVLATASGFLIGAPIGTALGGGDPNWMSAAIGAGLMVVSVPFTATFNRRAKNAVNHYNSGLKPESYHQPLKMNIGFATNGIGLVLKF